MRGNCSTGELGCCPGDQQAEGPVWCREMFLKSIVQTPLLGISLTIDSKALLRFCSSDMSQTMLMLLLCGSAFPQLERRGKSTRHVVRLPRPILFLRLPYKAVGVTDLFLKIGK